jgi:hypothetical protein
MLSKLIQELLYDASIIALVGARVYPCDLPQGAPLPALTVLEVSGAPLMADDGNVGIENGRMQIDCRSFSYADSKDLAVVVKNSLESSIAFLLIELLEERDMRDTGTGGEYPFHVVLDYNVWNRPTIT